MLILLLILVLSNAKIRNITETAKCFLKKKHFAVPLCASCLLPETRRDVVQGTSLHLVQSLVGAAALQGAQVRQVRAELYVVEVVELHSLRQQGATAPPGRMQAWVAPTYVGCYLVDLGGSRELAGFAYLARRQMDNGWIRGYSAYVSDDPEKWGEPVASGEFSSEQGGDEMRIEFSKPAKGRYLKLECLGEWRGRAYCAIAELSALVE